MRTTLVLHIIAGALGLVFGYVALFAVKGGPLHRRTGTLFVYTMLALSVLGIVMAVGRGVAPAVNVPAALLTSYLVITALTTVQPPFARSRWLDVGALLLVLAVSMANITFGIEAIAGGGKRHGIPAFPFLMFAVIGLLASVGDFRVIRSGALTGTSRVARHLWRMCYALFIAATSFFIGQAKVIPKVIRIPGLLALPILAVVIAMFYWLWRVRFRGAIVMRRVTGEASTTA